MVSCRRSRLGPTCTRKTGIEEQFTMAAEAIVDSIQNHEPNKLRKTRRNDGHERPIVYKSDDEYSSHLSSDEYEKNEHETYITRFWSQK